MKQLDYGLYNNYINLNKTQENMEAPKGRTRMNQTEIAMIRQYRTQGYSFEQISRFMNRSAISVKRVVYNWDGKY